MIESCLGDCVTKLAAPQGGVLSKMQRAALIGLFPSLVACTSTAIPRHEAPDAAPGNQTPIVQPDGSGEPPIVHTYAPTYTAIWDEIFIPTCALVFCHGGSDADYLVLVNEQRGYQSMFHDKVGPDCASLGIPHVTPGDPAKSLLYRKITDAPCGSRMPNFYGNPPLDPREVDQIKRWIELGAPYDANEASTDDGSVADAAPSARGSSNDAAPDGFGRRDPDSSLP